MDNTFIRKKIEKYSHFITDLDEACRQWAALFGAGSFLVDQHFSPRPSVPFDETYRGSHSEADLSYAWGQCGLDHHIQLFQQHDDQPSTYRGTFKKDQAGRHHVAICLNGVAAEKACFEAAVFPSVSQIPVADALQVSYGDARPVLKCFVELYRENPDSRRNFNMWKEAHESWEGKTELFRNNEW